MIDFTFLLGFVCAIICWILLFCCFVLQTLFSLMKSFAVNCFVVCQCFFKTYLRIDGYD